MDAKAILVGLLEKSQLATQAGMQMVEERKVIPPAGDERTVMLKGAGVGALADTRETATDLYLASAMVIDQDSDQERVYPGELAGALEVDASLTRQMEAPLRS